MKEKEKKLLDMLPKEGFIKLTGTKGGSLSRDQKAALIRKGNALYNEGKYDLAKRIFMTTGYSDGLIRLGDLYSEKNQSLEAFRMYFMAPHTRKVNTMIEKMAFIVKGWLIEE